MTIQQWVDALAKTLSAALMLVGGWTVGSWVRERFWPRPPHRCIAHLRLRRNLFVNADPDMLLTQGDDGTMEIEGYAIMPRSTYRELARQVGWEVPEC